jgi:hypothetical protein
MSRLVWVGVGAAGGIYGYRRGQRAWGRAKERGPAGTAAVMFAATTSAVHAARVAILDPYGTAPAATAAQSANPLAGPAPDRAERVDVWSGAPLPPHAAPVQPRRGGVGAAALRLAVRAARSSARPGAVTLG